MVDPRTKEYLRELNRAIEANKNAMNAAEEICTCQNCIESRLKKEISRCDKNRLLQYLPTIKGERFLNIFIEREDYLRPVIHS